jgi:hypothetical protein
MTPAVVAVLGGYGVFGRRIAASLARHPELGLLIAGRDPAAAAALAQELPTANVHALAMDATAAADIEWLLAKRPAVVVDTIGPFQSREFGLAERCMAAGIHYVDIADSRARVQSVADLDAMARAQGVCVITGASTVPALSTAIVDDLAPDPRSVLEIDVGISPGHRVPRGLATVRAIFSYCGKPIPPLQGDQPEYGWGALSRHTYPAPVGRRWLSNVDTPERALWRARYPSLQRATIKAGLEIGWMHLALAAWSRGVRAGLLPSPAPCAAFALRIAALVNRFGADAGAMHVRVTTCDRAGRTSVRAATIIATRGDGPQIPAAPAALIVKRLLGLPGYRRLTVRGAMPCIGLLTREEILSELNGFDVHYSVGGT